MGMAEIDRVQEKFSLSPLFQPAFNAGQGANLEVRLNGLR
jgi:hypothetical protein